MSPAGLKAQGANHTAYIMLANYDAPFTRLSFVKAITIDIVNSDLGTSEGRKRPPRLSCCALSSAAFALRSSHSQSYARSGLRVGKKGSEQVNQGSLASLHPSISQVLLSSGEPLQR